MQCGPFRVRDMHYGARESHPRHAHDESQLSIVLRGTMAENVNGVVHRGTAGDVVFKPAGQLHSDEFEATRIVCIDVDPHAFELPVTSYAWQRTMPVAAVAVRLARRFLGGEDPADDVDDLLALLPQRVVANRRVALRAARALDESFATSVSIESLATQLGVHRIYLARVFRVQWGCSPREYVQQLRVRAAAHALASTTTPIAAVALDAGFSDQPHMSRVFARALGATPAAFRRLARS